MCHIVSAIELLPLVLDFLLSILLLLLLLLGLDGKFFKLIPVDLHVGANDLVRDRGHRLVPMLLLRSIQQSLHNNRVRLRHVSLHHLLNRL